MFLSGLLLKFHTASFASGSVYLSRCPNLLYQLWGLYKEKHDKNGTTVIFTDSCYWLQVVIAPLVQHMMTHEMINAWQINCGFGDRQINYWIVTFYVILNLLLGNQRGGRKTCVCTSPRLLILFIGTGKYDRRWSEGRGNAGLDDTGFYRVGANLFRTVPMIFSVGRRDIAAFTSSTFVLSAWTTTRIPSTIWAKFIASALVSTEGTSKITYLSG